VNPTQDIPQGVAPATPEQPAGKPVSGIANAPEETQSRAKTLPLEVPVDLANLALGAGLLLSAFLIFWMGLYLSNHVALRAVVASFGTFALVWVLYRLRIFHRPHGGLIAAGAVALFAAALPFIERGFQKLDHAAKTGLAGEPAKPESDNADSLPVPTRQKMPAPPESPAPTAPAPPEEEPIRDLVAPALPPSAGKIMRVIQDAQVSIGGHKYRISAGSQFPYTKFENGTVTFKAGEQEVTIDSELVTFTGKSLAPPEEITKLSGAELMRRYPAIGVKNSPENELYVARVKELRIEMPGLFNDPHWPLTIGEQLAAQEGWDRAGTTADENATPAQQPPAANGKPANPQSPTPPAPSDPPVSTLPSNIPQEAPK
jgi:hypothetical protein